MRDLDQSLLFFKKVLGEKGVLCDPESLKEYAKDWTSPDRIDATCVLLPKTTEEVSSILKHCSEHNLKVVPSGGRTGLAGGAVASHGEMILSMTRMNRLIHIDRTGLTVEVEAGVTVQTLQEEVLKQGLYYGVDLGSRGSCQIGGSIATNAGGLKFIRYGGTREQVLGLEVVLANGELLNLNKALPKDNTGYKLFQLFIGSEGTLGVITKATLKLTQKPKNLKVACLGLESVEALKNCLSECHQAGLTLTAFEFFTEKCLELVLKNFSLKNPFSESSPYYALVEIEEYSESELETFLEKIFEKNLLSDAVLSSTTEEFHNLWALRENITESLAMSGHVRKNDVSVAVKDIGVFLESLELISQKSSSVELYLFGHLGDGNVHVNYSAPFSIDKAVFLKSAKDMEEKVFQSVYKFKGSISAEHGIGTLKKADFQKGVGTLEFQLMQQIKKIFDPQDILNSGKIF